MRVRCGIDLLADPTAARGLVARQFARRENARLFDRKRLELSPKKTIQTSVQRPWP